MGLFDLGIGGLYKGFNSFMHPERGYEKAQEQLDKYFAQGQNALSPYMQQGQAAYEPMFGAMQNLLNPEELYNQWAQNYSTSPYAQDLMGRAQTQGLDAASSMGLLGSTPALQAIQAGTSQIYNQDRGNYIDDMTKRYLAGAQMAQGLYGSGQNAAGQFGQNAMNMGNNSAQMAFGQQNAPGSMFNDLLKAATYGFGGGGNMGGQMGNSSPWSITSGGR